LQEVEFLRVFGLKYQPDYVLIGFCMNDFDIYADGGVYKALFKINSHMTDRGDPPRIIKYILNHSRLAFFLYHKTRGLFPVKGLSEEYEHEVLKGKNTVEAGMELLASLQRRHHFKSLLFISPSFKRPFSKYQHDDIHQQVFDIVNNYDEIDFLDLTKDFQTINEDASVFGIDGVHPNHFGHKTLADILYQKLNLN